MGRDNINLSKFFIALLVCTMAAVLYVSQQVEATKLGYQINAQQAAMEEMLDQRQMLLYNVYHQKSPEKLQENFAKKSGKPEDYRIFGNKQIIILSGAEVTKKNSSARFFGLSSLAQAQTQD